MMPWKVYSSGLPAQSEGGALIELDCESAETEEEARLRAMHLYQRGAGRIAVRRPDSPVLITGAALEEWLTDRLSGTVRR